MTRLGLAAAVVAGVCIIAAPVVAQWTLLKELVDRRTFSWTSLFSVLEQTLPPSVRLLTITPRLDKGVLRLELTAATRSYEAGYELMRRRSWQ